MKFIWMNGGLGNQAFQYIFMRYLEITTGDTCMIDDCFFYQNPQHNGYELERIWGLKPNLLSDQFTTDVWDEIITPNKLILNPTSRQIL